MKAPLLSPVSEEKNIPMIESLLIEQKRLSQLSRRYFWQKIMVGGLGTGITALLAYLAIYEDEQNHHCGNDAARMFTGVMKESAAAVGALTAGVFTLFFAPRCKNLPCIKQKEVDARLEQIAEQLRNDVPAP